MDAIQSKLTYIMFYNVFIIKFIVNKILTKHQLSIVLNLNKTKFTYKIFYNVKHNII